MRTENDSSILPSIRLRAVTKRPTSVSGFASGIRADKSPAAIASAVTSTSVNGLSEIEIIRREISAMSNRTTNPTNRKSERSR